MTEIGPISNPPSVPSAGTARRIVLVHSPKAGRSAKGAAALRALEAAGVEIAETVAVGALDHNAPLGRQWRERGYAAAVAAGGDGTIGAVATQIAGTDLALGILPLGTSNDTARSLGIPLDAEEAARVIARGVPTAVDAGQALPAATEPFALSPETHDPSPEHTARIGALAAHGATFLHALTLGLNVAFAKLATDIARRERWGRLNYAASALEALAHFEPVPMTLRLTGVKRSSDSRERPDAAGNLVIECEAIQVAAVNLPVFGGEREFRLPQVGLRDRLLDFVVIEAPEPPMLREIVEGWLRTLREAAERLRHPRAAGTHPAQGADDEEWGFALPGASRYQASSATVETRQPVDVTLDGEVRARTPTHIRVMPEPVRILLPPGVLDRAAPDGDR